jgi:lipoate-protein ligase A
LAIEELRSYDALRHVGRTTLELVSITSAMLVLGSSQPPDILAEGVESKVTVRRRRGGGGAVLLRPGDLWVDLWIPADDPRFTRDVVAAAINFGIAWRNALASLGVSDLEVTSTNSAIHTDLDVACFAGRGAGEVFTAAGKVVGLTQWRSREGSLLSTVLPLRDSTDLVELLRAPPDELTTALEHPSLSSLGLSDSSGDVINALRSELDPVDHVTTTRP